MADKVEGIHDKLNGDLDVKVAEIHQLMLSMATNMDRSPRLDPIDSTLAPTVPRTESGVASSAVSPMTQTRSSDTHTYQHPFTPEMTPEMVGSEFSSQSPQALSPGNLSVNGFDTRRASDIIPVQDQYRLPSYYNEPPPEYKLDRRSVTLNLNVRSKTNNTPSLTADSARSSSLGSLRISSLSPVTLPPPILSPEHNNQDMRPRNASLADKQVVDPADPSRAISTISQQHMFERRLFGDAATLCDA